jgi:tRNA G26 N,N-dimethylase Trm1
MEPSTLQQATTTAEGPSFHIEGGVKFLTKHVTESAKGFEEETVFYNPVQVFNRDLSVLAIHEFCKMQSEKNPEKFKGMRFYDALSASGLSN